MVRDEKGAVLLLIFIFMVGAAGVTLAFISLVNNELRAVAYTRNRAQAYYIAEAGLDRAMEYLESDSDNDWSNDDGTSVITENFGEGSYDINLGSGITDSDGNPFPVATTTTIWVESVGTVGSGTKATSRTIQQRLWRLPEAFNYALFWEGTGTCDVNRGSVVINGGDVFTKGAISSTDVGTIDVANGGTPTTTNGGFVYTTSSWTASGTYTEGTKPGDEPSYPTLDTTFYDAEITTAEAQTIGDLSWTGGSQVLSGTTYVNGTITIDGTAVTGNGALVATGDITVQGSSTITPDSDVFIRLISKTNITITGTATTATGTFTYARTNVEIDGITVTGAFISSDTLTIKGGATVTGYAYADTLEIRENSTVNGSLVTNRFAGNKISNPNKTITINFKHSYLEEAAPGLGLDIDGDANQEGIISRVPNNWQG